MTRRESANAYDPSLDGSFGVVSAAHELKTPTALMRQLALELRMQAATQYERELLDQIILTSEKSLRLTNDLTKTVRLGELPIDMEPVNAVQMCEEVAHEIWPLYRAQGKRLEVASRTRDAPLVIANRDLLRRVLLNFADNALQYSGSDAKVLLGVRRKGGEVTIGLRDHGPVAAANVTGGATAPTGRPESSGLGLVITRKFAEAMNARVGTTRHRNGMTFYVSMPESRQLALL